MKEEELLKKLREAFNSEARERLISLSSGLFELEKTSEPDKQKPILEVVFREAHSLKGAARAVNLTDIETLCQSVESVFSALKREEIPLSSELFDTLHFSVGIIENISASSIEDQSIQNKENLSTLIKQLEDLKQEAVKNEVEKKEDVPLQAGIEKREQEVHEIERGNAEEKGRDRRRRSEDRGQKGVHEIKLSKPTNEAPMETHGVRSRPVISETVRISTSKLDSLLLKAEELISLKLVSNQHVHNLKDVTNSLGHWKKRWSGVEPEVRVLRKQVQSPSALVKSLEFLDWSRDYIQSLEREIRTLSKTSEQDHRALAGMIDDLLDDMKKATMLPFSTLFGLFPRMVRDISRDQSKEVDLVLNGEEIEIDRRVLEEMKDPLIHLLRNIIDHGIETPGKRAEFQKPPKGTINLTVSQTEGNKIEILISDDGKGIDLTKVKEKAIKQGILSEKEAEDMKDREAAYLIFRSGVSTSPIITQISGRGIGLAIVQEKVEELGGLISVESEPGKGSCFRMQLPVTLATFRGVLVQVADALFIMPCSHVECVLKIEEDKVKTVENRATIPLNGQVLPLLELSDVLKLTNKKRQNADKEYITVVVLGAGKKRIAFSVDKIMDEQEVLVKNLGKQLSRVSYLAGATVLGTGKVVPILNVNDLLKSPTEAISIAHRAKVTEDKEDSVDASLKKSILVVEDSITSRMLIKNILESDGYLVKTAVDGLDAYTTLKTEEFDLVVSDIEMPRMNGFELTSKIRSDTKLSEIPLVLVTSLDSREDRERGVDVGANAYIAKGSFDQSNLLEVVQRLI
ncbi:MAG: hybrid sensor histidine kinase/response regulator [Deltaproteobacteria bacterium]|nr:MAG: hybrid sensor histidine kinase/response regulator [Deltaproteobacteria bacterium]